MRPDARAGFVNVHNGVQLKGVTQVTQAAYDAHTGAKWIRDGQHYIATATDKGRAPLAQVSA
ncbi:hypothetical protein GCM10010517_40770 [Streptosporangium fragile]|uniref:Uncharacterized protein n=1 Tax=Streptosporangium fragile TaxID=46186 RepID=A0ABN3W053_9ACTN